MVPLELLQYLTIEAVLIFLNNPIVVISPFHHYHCFTISLYKLSLHITPKLYHCNKPITTIIKALKQATKFGKEDATECTDKVVA